MRVMITGASGMLGHSVMAKFSEVKNIEVIAISGREDANLESRTETRALIRFTKPDAVVHLAASVYGLGGNLKYPADIYKSNIYMNTNIIDAACHFGVKKLVMAGTAAIYSDSAKMPYQEEDCLSGEPHHSEYAYATAKRAMLVQLRSCKQQYGLEYAYAIATNMYGPYDKFNPAVGHVVPSLIAKFLTAAATGGNVEVWGDGTPTRDFLHSYDAAQALLILLEKGSGAFNIASGKVYRIRDLVSLLASIFPQVQVTWNSSKPNGQIERSYNVDRIQSLGFRPAYDLAEGLRQTVEWCLRNPNIYESRK